MSVWRAIRFTLLAIASLGYFANGAQAHLHVSSGETLDLILCGTGSAQTLTLEIPGSPIEESSETCCGDCLFTGAILPPEYFGQSSALEHVLVPTPAMPAMVSPRSPLWPGAPPQGPPSSLKA